jgi:hypothetical protein
MTMHESVGLHVCASDMRVPRKGSGRPRWESLVASADEGSEKRKKKKKKKRRKRKTKEVLPSSLIW